MYHQIVNQKQAIISLVALSQYIKEGLGLLSGRAAQQRSQLH